MGFSISLSPSFFFSSGGGFVTDVDMGQVVRLRQG